MRNQWIFSLMLLICVGSVANAQYSITVLHNNDGESQVINAGAGLEEFGGIARFATLVENTRNFYQGVGHGVLTISSGDNFLAGPEFEASLLDGVFYDALAISRIDYDAVAIGNHEFDFGPEVLSGFVDDAQTTNSVTFLSSNLDFSAQASLQNQADGGSIAASIVVTVPTDDGDKNIGVIGATTENLPFISSPGLVTVGDVATAVNAEIVNLQGQGVDLIILASHLQGIEEDEALVPMLNGGISLIIAGGGDDLLATLAAPAAPVGAPASVATTGLISGDASGGDYPTISSNTDLAGNNIPIVATDANYKYVGRITLNVDAMGAVSVDPSSNPQRVASLVEDPANGVAADSTITMETVVPVQAFIDNLTTTVIGTTSEMIVGGASSDLIRSNERAGGNLVADAFLDQATALASDFGVGEPDIAIVNGGGIRADIDAGDITLLDTFNISPFGNFVSVVEGVTTADLLLLLENAYSRTVDGPEKGIDPIRQGDGTGRFAHLSGLSVVYDIFADALELDENGFVTQAGARVLEITLGDGTRVVSGGRVCVDRTFNIATASFLAGGGDQYFGPYLSQSYGFVSLGVTDQQSVAALIQGFDGADVAGDARYDSIPDGRIVATTASVPGDVNRDGEVDLLDVSPFVDLLSIGCFQAEADVNGDGDVNLLDVAPFVSLL